MNIKKIALFIALFLFCFTIISNISKASSDENDTRYFVKSNASFWKKSFGVRHSFDNGFTSDLNDWQLKLAKLFNVEIEPVKKLNILVTDSAIEKPKNVRSEPVDYISWGVKAIYGDSLLESTSGGLGVNVAVLDTGIIKHPDIEKNIVDCKDFSTNKPIVDGKCEDKNGHGTHVAGIIAANGGTDGKGIYGVAPEASLYAYKVCSNNGSCWADDVAVAIKTATDKGANIINLSLGSDLPSDLIINAISYAVSKDVLVIAAAGNDGPDSGSIDYPAADPNVISVGAVDIDGNVPDWSARGINSTTEQYSKQDKDVEFAAPGVNVESTFKDGGYSILSGTSMAAPHIAGLAAKLWPKDTEKPAEVVRDSLHKISEDILPPYDDDASGWGMPVLNF